MVVNAIFVACTAWLLVLLVFLALFLVCAKCFLRRVLEFDIALAVGMFSGAVASVVYVVYAAKEKSGESLSSQRIADMMLATDIFYLLALCSSKVTIVLALRRIFSLRFSTFILPALLTTSISLILGLAAVSMQCYPFIPLYLSRICVDHRNVWLGLWVASATCDAIFESGFTFFTIYISRKAGRSHRRIIRWSFCGRIINIAPTIARTVLLTISPPTSTICVVVVTQLSIDISLFSCLGTARHMLIEPFGAMMRRSGTPIPSRPMSELPRGSDATLMRTSLRSVGSRLSIPLSMGNSVQEIPRSVSPALLGPGKWRGDDSFGCVGIC